MTTESTFTRAERLRIDLGQLGRSMFGHPGIRSIDEEFAVDRRLDEIELARTRQVAPQPRGKFTDFVAAKVARNRGRIDPRDAA